MMHVLITRPEGDGEILKERIEQLGSRATLEPLINIVFETIPLSSVAGATVLIATSRNALKALASSPALGAALALPLYTVGPGTTGTLTWCGDSTQAASSACAISRANFGAATARSAYQAPRAYRLTALMRF